MIIIIVIVIIIIIITIVIVIIRVRPMEVGQYHVYLTAHAQNAVQRILALPTKARTHSLIYDYY